MSSSIEQMPAESQQITPLLVLLQTMGSEEALAGLFGSNDRLLPQIIECLNSPSLTSPVLAILLEILENLLNFVPHILHRHTSAILSQFLSPQAKSSPLWSGHSQLRMHFLSRLSEYVDDSAQV